LANNNWARADNHDRLDVGALWLGSAPLFANCRGL
jgi:hypothetical protein